MSEQSYAYILEALPYAEPFLFVDGISRLDAEGVEGYYRFRAERDCYRGHFPGAPVTPGVLLTECCAQIGLVCLGIYLLGEAAMPDSGQASIALAETNMQFLQPVPPGEEVRVRGEKIYFRFNKLKAAVYLYREDGVLACKGEIAGMFKPWAL